MKGYKGRVIVGNSTIWLKTCVQIYCTLWWDKRRGKILVHWGQSNRPEKWTQTKKLSLHAEVDPDSNYTLHSYCNYNTTHHTLLYRRVKKTCGWLLCGQWCFHMLSHDNKSHHHLELRELCCFNEATFPPTPFGLIFCFSGPVCW